MSLESNDLRSSRVGQISIVVHDLARATACYRDLLGLRLLMEFPGLAFFDCGGTRLFLNEQADAGPESILYLRVDSIQFTYDQLQTGY